MAELQRVKAVDPSKPVLPHAVCPIVETEINVEVQQCPQMVCLDGLEGSDCFLVERFHGCGYGEGAAPWMECGRQVTLNACRNVYVFVLPGRYRVRREDCTPIDPDRIHIERSDLTFEFAQLWVQSQCCSRGACCE